MVEDVWRHPECLPRLGYIARLAYLSLMASALAFRLYYELIREIGPGNATWAIVVIPVVAMAQSTAFEGFIWTWMTIAGEMLAIAALVVALRSRR